MTDTDQKQNADEQRRDEALKRALNMPPRQHKEDVGKDKCREAERSSRLTKSKAGKLTNQRESDA